jgi:hypothetical protein
MSFPTTIEIKGVTTDQNGNVIPAKVFATDKDGVPVRAKGGEALYTDSSLDGEFSIVIPAMSIACVTAPCPKIPAIPYLTARYGGQSETLKIDGKEMDFAIGSKSIEAENTVIFAPKPESHWEKNKWKYIIGLISLVVMAIVLAIIFKNKEN